jgi:ferredoxin
MSKQICIIGAGPNGLACALAAIHLGYKVVLIDPWIDYRGLDDEVQTNKVLQKSIAKKTFRGSLLMYDYPQSFIKRNSLLDFPLSLTRGGLTSVWGSNSYPWNEVAKSFEESDFNAEIIQVLEENISIESRLNESQFSSNFVSGIISKSTSEKHPAISFETSFVALNRSACVLCGECLSGCTYDAIFNAELLWNSLIRSKKVELLKGFVDKVEKNPDAITITYSIGNQTQEIQTPRLFVACGAIASTALLQRSSIIDEEVQLQDSQVFYTGLIKLSLRAELQTKFNLVQAYCRIKLKTNFIHLSIYEASPVSVQRIIGMSRIMKLIPRTLFRWVLPVIGFLPEKNSQKVTLKFNGLNTEIQTSSHSKKALFFNLTFLRHFFSFIRLGILHIPFSLKFSTAGASYHLGKLQKDGICLLDKNGQPYGGSGIHVVDSSSLQNIRPGPITVFSMFNSTLITLRVLKDLG